MLTYIPLLKNYPPSCLSIFMVDMQVSLGKNIIPWPPLALLFGITENWNDGSTNYRFQWGNIINHNFLINGGEMICIVAAVWITIPLVSLLWLLFYKNTDVNWYESWWWWEMLVKGFILGYMQILLTCLFNIKHAAFEKTIDKFSYILSFFGLAFCIIGYGIFIAMTVWYKSLPSWKKAEWKYINFFWDIDKTDAW